MIRTRTTLLAVLLLASCDGGGVSPATDDPCTSHVQPGGDDQISIQLALLQASAGSVVCLDEGIYSLSDGLSLGVPGVAVRAPAGRAILDFSAQASDAPGLQLLGDDIDVQGIELRNTARDAIRVVGGDGVRLRNVRVGWGEDAPPVPGARGVVVEQASNVELESLRIRGAAGPGIEVESSAAVSIDRPTVTRCLEGIVVRDSVDVAVRGERIVLSAENP